jgi:hypothetical protein
MTCYTLAAVPVAVPLESEGSAPLATGVAPEDSNL